MRILAGAVRGLGNGGAFERFERAAAYFITGKAWFVDANRFFDLCADADDGIERRHWLLKHHGDFAAA
jgi:hypothetical protein